MKWMWGGETNKDRAKNTVIDMFEAAKLQALKDIEIGAPWVQEFTKEFESYPLALGEEDKEKQLSEREQKNTRWVEVPNEERKGDVRWKKVSIDKEEKIESRTIAAKPTKDDLTSAVNDALPERLYQAMISSLHDFSLQSAKRTSTLKEEAEAEAQKQEEMDVKSEKHEEATVEEAEVAEKKENLLTTTKEKMAILEKSVKDLQIQQKEEALEALKVSADRAESFKTGDSHTKELAKLDVLEEFGANHLKAQEELPKHFSYFSDKELGHKDESPVKFKEKLRYKDKDRETIESALEKTAQATEEARQSASEESKQRAKGFVSEAQALADQHSEQNAQSTQKVLAKTQQQVIEESTQKAKSANEARYKAEDKAIRAEEYDRAMNVAKAEKSYGTPKLNETIEKFNTRANERIATRTQGREFSWGKQQEGIAKRIEKRLERETHLQFNQQFPETLVSVEETAKNIASQLESIKAQKSQPQKKNEAFEARIEALSQQSFFNSCLQKNDEKKEGADTTSGERVATFKEEMRTASMNEKINAIKGGLEGKHYKQKTHSDVQHWQKRFSGSEERVEGAKSVLSSALTGRYYRPRTHSDVEHWQERFSGAEERVEGAKSVLSDLLKKRPGASAVKKYQQASVSDKDIAL